MITLDKDGKEAFEFEFKLRTSKMRSPIMKGLLTKLYTNALTGEKIGVTDLAKVLETTADDIIKKVSNLNTIHGVRIFNKSAHSCKSDYKLKGFFKPRKRNRKKVTPAPVMMFQVSGNEKLLNEVFR